MAARRSTTRGRRRLPSGLLTFAFTDIGGSTRLFQRLGDRWPILLRRHDALMEQAVADHDGIVLSHEGDGYFAVFTDALAAVRAMAAAQVAVGREPWPDDAPVRVRIGVHTGYATPYDGTYVALAVHQAARVGQAAHPGQTLLTEATVEAAGSLPEGLFAHPLGPHRLKDFELPQALYELRGPHLPSAFPPLATIWRGANNLPLPRTSFIGRDRDVEQVSGLLDESRLVTIVGAGGVGKTRLATHAAASMLDGSGDGAWLVTLADLPPGGDVAAAALRAIGAADRSGGTSTEALTSSIGDRRMLLVLDNCEHVADVCAAVVDELLGHCPRLHILATSRHPLQLAGEQLYRLTPLEVPPAALPLTPSEASGYESVQLFMDRAHHHVPAFALDDETLPAVLDICRRLDGLPLALELAAARLRTMSAAAVARRLGDQLTLLVGTQRGVDTRQQTLRGLLDWSFELLDDDEQALVTELSVFAGGWMLSSAEAVCTSPRRGTVDVLGDLVDKSLVHTESVGGDLRYSLLEPVRQYAGERLVGNPPWAADVGRRHAEHFLALAEQARRELNTPLQHQWLMRLDLESANLLAALDRSLADAAEDAEATAGLAPRLLAALATYWVLRGRAASGMHLAERVLATAAPDTPAPVRARALIGAGTLATRAGEFGAARRFLEQAVDVARGAEDRRSVAVALNDLAWLANRRDELETAAAYAAEALATAEAEDESHLAGRVLATLGDTAERANDLTRAREHFERSERLLASTGDRVGAAKVANNLGLIDMMLGDLPRARHALEKCLAVFDELQDAASLPTVLSNLGLIALAEHDIDHADELFRRALRLGNAAGDTELVVYTLLGLAVAAGDAGGQERSAVLHGAVDTLAAALGMALDMLEEQLRQRSRSDVEAALGPAGFEAALRRGRELPESQAVAYALADPSGGSGATYVVADSPTVRSASAVAGDTFTTSSS